MAGAPLGGKRHEEGLAVVVLGAKDRAAVGFRGLNEAFFGLGGKDDGAGAGFDGASREGIAVNLLAREGNEGVARRDAARIDSDLARKLCARAAYHKSSRDARNVIDCHTNHVIPPFLVNGNDVQHRCCVGHYCREELRRLV